MSSLVTIALRVWPMVLALAALRYAAPVARWAVGRFTR